ncbi:MAG TPA: 3-phosphoshikimate 1-carboxyvinyltransferase, partial [Acidimicrobiia bacterium]|nr:3-phosphoshikimate 1-carboxyvinyltransferase [Acidimicrobiia bacterium]
MTGAGTPAGGLPAELSLSGARPLRGRMRVPGDKSISHRAVLFAALASGASRLSGLADGGDVAASRAAVEALGVKVRESTRPSGEPVLVVRGGGFEGLAEPEGVLDCGNSGTS